VGGGAQEIGQQIFCAVSVGEGHKGGGWREGAGGAYEIDEGGL